MRPEVYMNDRRGLYLGSLSVSLKVVAAMTAAHQLPLITASSLSSQPV